MSGNECLSRFQSVPTVHILGVRIHALTVPDLHQLFAATIDSHERALVLHVNAHGMNLAHDRPWLVDVLNQADLVYCDGGGVVLGARLLGQHLPGRITLADWLWELAGFAAQRGYSLFLLGARPGIAAKAADQLCQRFPDLKIAGTHHGYFDKTPGSAENEAVLQAIRDSKPDILLVGFGMPIQERWLHDNWPCLDTHVAIAGGAIFDFISGELKRAPTWMNDNGLEWLGRLLVEPNRLWQRYLLGNPLFLARVLRARLSHKATSPPD
jgi:N-acetylglucosaminyldiphosphoundecaprenol N-acetyl-beta-D-mannosaminyltransferase